MIYPEGFEGKLGFDNIRQRLASLCLSPLGIAKVMDMGFQTDVAFIQTLLLQTLEFKKILERNLDFPSRYFHDPSTWLHKISIEGNYLDEGEFVQLAHSLETIYACIALFAREKATYPSLYRLTEGVDSCHELAKKVYALIDDHQVVRDKASDELNSIRKRLRDERGNVRRLGDKIFRQAVVEKWVPDGSMPTIRDGRLVFPISSEHKRKLKGYIVDESATGQTVFIEPAEMVEANNEIRDLEYEEKREVVRILKQLTAVFRQRALDLEQAFDFLAEVDFIRAKAKFSVETDATLPGLVGHPCLSWHGARHPLLYLGLKGKRDIVPLTIDLNDQERMLLVSGPNAGGKSVCLKTVGLIQYMVQCGLLAPLFESSSMGVFTEIFLDIGDQQSIENDLSTYSSHLHNMKMFMQSAGPSSLLLMDELGSGTDPDFGGTIAEAVLNVLLKKKAWGVVTTHYHNLKLFAGKEKGIRNAAMRFDDLHLRPAFILDIGKPGSSFALEIARKIGLPQPVIEQAEALAGKELAGFETLVRDLEKERGLLHEKIRNLEGQEASLRKSLAHYESLSADLESKKKSILEKAKGEASRLLKDTNREIEKTIRHIQENKAEKKETQKARKGLKELSEKVSLPEYKPAKVLSGSLNVGDRVRLLGQEGSGVVLSIKDKKVMVQMGEIKSMVPLDRLEKAIGGSPSIKSTTIRRAGIDIQEKQSMFNTTLDIRGKRAEEVIPLLGQFIDTAILLGQSQLRILHGKGEGILRKVIREQLKQYREVASMGNEAVERGGEGITVVVLK